MCIVVTINCPEVAASKVEYDFQDGSTLFVLARRDNYKQKKIDAFNISDIQVGGCACGLLGGGASWEKDTWIFKAGMLPLLEETISRLAKHLPSGFSFEAAWNGEELPQTRDVTIEEMKRIVRDNQVETKTRYRIES